MHAIHPHTPAWNQARRREYFQAAEARKASHMPPLGRFVYLHRHALAFVLRWVVLIGLASVTAWAWVPIVAIPLHGLAKAAGWIGPRA